MDLRARNNTNRLNGAGWEAVFQRQSRAKGYLAIQVGLSAKKLGAFKVIAVRSHLDWQLIRNDGAVSFLDTKTYAERFTYSNILPHQLERARMYEQWGVPSGFVVWFRKNDQVVHFSAKQIILKGARQSFGAEDGTVLGSISSFDIGLIFSKKSL